LEPTSEIAERAVKMMILKSVSVAMALALATGSALAESPERIVFVRHGEKPPLGLGQLDCQGLNRALALPAYFAKTFGKPDAMFAPNPSVQKKDAGRPYDYIRPLITIEPTAIFFGLPVNVDHGLADIDGLRAALEAPDHAHALVFVAWEHKIIDVIVRDLLKAHGGDPATVPDWEEDDYDSVDLVTLDGDKASFTRLREGLNDQSKACPG
jgi:hypothetical protein